MGSSEKVLKILGDESRFKIIQLLLSHDFCVGAISHHVGISKPAVSQHLKILREAGLVKGEKRGYWTHYVVDRNILREAGESLLEMAKKKQYSGTIGIFEKMPESKRKGKKGGD
jgi:DNA-binding transcriptional ArsR family regulator